MLTPTPVKAMVNLVLRVLVMELRQEIWVSGCLKLLAQLLTHRWLGGMAKMTQRHRITQSHGAAKVMAADS